MRSLRPVRIGRWLVVAGIWVGAAAWTACGRDPGPPPAPPSPRAEGSPATGGSMPPPVVAFAGAAACMSCHGEAATAWSKSSHGRHGTPIADPEGGFDRAVGGQWMQAYVRRDAQGFHRILPRCYDVRQKGWRDVAPVLTEIAGTWLGRPVEAPTPLEMRSFESDCAACHASQPTQRMNLVDGRLASGVVDASINCEACHGPGRAHGEAWARLEPGPRLADLARLPAHDAAAICGRCHGGPPVESDFAPADASHVVAALEDHAGFFPDGRASGQIYQYPAFVRSPCHVKGGLVCTSCHDPHRDSLRSRGETDSLCIGCHAGKASRSHTHHDPRGEGARCIECHMPRLRTGLLAHQRDHSLGVPVPSVEDAPDACTACHREENKAWADRALRERWGPSSRATIDATRAISLARAQDPEARPLLRTALAHRDPFFRGNAAIYLADPAPILHDPSPEVRRMAVRAAARSGDAVAADRALTALTQDGSVVVRAEAWVELSRRGHAVPERACDDFVLAVRLNRAQKALRLLLAGLLRRQGELDASAEALIAAISLDPALPASWPDLPDVFEALGRTREAAGMRAYFALRGASSEGAPRGGR